MKRSIKSVTGHSRIDGIIPGVRGQRAFPNREVRNMDPFIMLDHIGPQKMNADFYVDGKGGAHPHRGFETITFMFEGRMGHMDSKGGRAQLHSGSVQRMNAGKGIQHGGDFEGDKQTNRFHEVQLWVNLPANLKMSEPEIHNAQQKDIPEIKKGNSVLRIIGGELNGIEGPIKTKVNTQVAHLISNDIQTFTIGRINLNYNLFVYALEGDFTVNGTELAGFHGLTFNHDGDELEITTKGKGQLLIAAGKPIKEPVVMGGPFVMNTEQEIEQAYIDFRNGLFGTI